MGWKGTLRSMEAAQRRYEREARRRQRDLERQRAQLEKMEELERAAYEVEVFENHIDILLSFHKECGDTWDWKRIQSSSPPRKPVKATPRQDSAMTYLDSYSPGLGDKLLRRSDSKRAALWQAVEEARETDEQQHRDDVKDYERDYVDWQMTRELAARVLAGDPEAYVQAIEQVNPFEECDGVGLSLSFRTEDSELLEATLQVNDQDVVPKEALSLLKSGKLSVKKMTKTRHFELFQDHVCGCVLRVARELLALLPLTVVIVTAETQLLNTQTGHMELQPILSALIPRSTLEALNFDMLDPSDAMNNFVHRTKFLKTKGFQAVDALKPSDLYSASEP